jgi:hypothetical protein
MIIWCYRRKIYHTLNSKVDQRVRPTTDTLWRLPSAYSEIHSVQLEQKRKPARREVPGTEEGRARSSEKIRFDSFVLKVVSVESAVS